jgi:hypothetical protein
MDIGISVGTLLSHMAANELQPISTELDGSTLS